MIRCSHLKQGYGDVDHRVYTPQLQLYLAAKTWRRYSTRFIGVAYARNLIDEIPEPVPVIFTEIRHS
jgi:hypothetical protein